MGIIEGMEEGNYASSENLFKNSTTHRDPGLTLFPGSQIPNEAEERLRCTAELQVKVDCTKDNGEQGLRSQSPDRHINESWGSHTPLLIHSKPGSQRRHTETNSQNARRSIKQSCGFRPRPSPSSGKSKARFSPGPVVNSHHCHKPTFFLRSVNFGLNHSGEGNENIGGDDIDEDRDIRDLSHVRKRRIVERSSLTSINNSRRDSETRAHLSETCVEETSGPTNIVADLVSNGVAKNSVHGPVATITGLAWRSPSHDKNKNLSSSEESSADDGEEIVNTDACPFCKENASTTHLFCKKPVSGLGLSMVKGSDRGSIKQYVGKKVSEKRKAEIPLSEKHYTVAGICSFRILNNPEGLTFGSRESKANYPQLDKRKASHPQLPKERSNYSQLNKKKPSHLQLKKQQSNYSQFKKQESLYNSFSFPMSIIKSLPTYFPSSSKSTLHRSLQQQGDTNEPSAFTSDPSLHTLKRFSSLHKITPPQTFGQVSFEFVRPIILPSIKFPNSHGYRKRSTSLPDLRSTTSITTMGSQNTSNVTENSNHNLSVGDGLPFTPNFPQIYPEHMNQSLNDAYRSTVGELMRVQTMFTQAQHLLRDLSCRYQTIEASYQRESHYSNELRSDLQLKSQELSEARERTERYGKICEQQEAEILAFYIEAQDSSANARKWEAASKMWQAKAIKSEEKVGQLQALLQQGVPKLTSAKKILEKITGDSPEQQTNPARFFEKPQGPTICFEQPSMNESRSVVASSKHSVAKAPLLSCTTPIDLTGDEEDTEAALKPIESEPSCYVQTQGPVVERSNELKRVRYAEWMGDQNPLRIMKKPRLDGTRGTIDPFDNPPAFGTLMSYSTSKLNTSSGSEGNVGCTAKKSKPEKVKPSSKRCSEKRISHQQVIESYEEGHKQFHQEAEKKSQAGPEKPNLEAPEKFLPINRSRPEYLGHSGELDQEFIGRRDDGEQPSTVNVPTIANSLGQSVLTQYQLAISPTAEDRQARKDEEQKAAHDSESIDPAGEAEIDDEDAFAAELEAALAQDSE